MKEGVVGEAAPAFVVEHSVVVAASPRAIWSLVVDPEASARWLGGFRLVSDWTVGAAIAMSGVLNGREYSERGMVLTYVHESLLRYDHWSQLWRVPDVPSNRAIVELQVVGRDEGALVRFRHDLPQVEAIAEHSRFFWSVSLADLKRVAEGG